MNNFFQTSKLFRVSKHRTTKKRPVDLSPFHGFRKSLGNPSNGTTAFAQNDMDRFVGAISRDA